MAKKPVIGIPIGDPAGIGPEIVVKAFTEEKIFDACKPLVIGERNVLQQIVCFV